jgi:hypothetical protein
MKNRSAWVPSVVLALLAPVGVRAQQAEGPVFRSGAAEITLGGRVHTQFNTTTAESEPTADLFLRRVRLESAVRVNEVVSGKVQVDFAGSRVNLKDAYLQLTFSPAFQLLAGNAQRPFSLLENTSSNRILPIERGLRIRGVRGLDEYGLVSGLQYSDRDVGLQLMGEPEGAPLGFTYQVGAFRGPLHGAVRNLDTYQLAARATVRPAERLRLGAAWSGRDFIDTIAAPGGGRVTRLERGNAFEVDLEYGAFAPGFHLLGEVAFGDLPPGDEEEFVAAQAWLGYRTRPLSPAVSALEPIFRASWSDVEEGGMLLTPGVNFYLGPLSRVMFNYDFWIPGGDGDVEGSFKAMFQLAF